MNNHLAIQSFNEFGALSMFLTLLKMETYQELSSPSAAFVLEHLDSQDGPVTLEALEDALAECEDLDEVLEELEEEEYITIAHDTVALTDTGRETVNAIHTSQAHVARDIFTGISEAEQQQLISIMDRMAKNMDALMQSQEQEQEEAEEFEFEENEN